LEILCKRSADFLETSATAPDFFYNPQHRVRSFFRILSNRSEDFLKTSARGPLFFLNRTPPGRAFFANGRMVWQGSVGECDDYSWVGQTSGPGRADVFLRILSSRPALFPEFSATDPLFFFNPHQPHRTFF